MSKVTIVIQPDADGFANVNVEFNPNLYAFMKDDSASTKLVEKILKTIANADLSELESHVDAGPFHVKAVPNGPG